MTAAECFVVAALFDLAFWLQPGPQGTTFLRRFDRWIPAVFFAAGCVKLVQS